MSNDTFPKNGIFDIISQSCAPLRGIDDDPPQRTVVAPTPSAIPAKIRYCDFCAEPLGPGGCDGYCHD